MKIALICDWLTGMRGGERCLEAVCEIYPQANIFTLVHFSGSVSKTIESHRIYTSYIQKLPGNIKNFRRYLPLFSHAIEKFNFNGYDCALSFSHCVAKNIVTPPNVPHICYCYTPMRYAWHMKKDYLNNLNLVTRIPAALLLSRLKKYDRTAASRVTHFIADSINVQNRIKQAYNKDSVVIYPPVDCERFTLSDADNGYYLIVSALVPYKRVDVAINAFNETAKKLVIIGNGPELNRLKKSALSNISFVENASDEEVADYMRKCTALIFPTDEDFGIVPLEAQACGKPVIAYAKGGALETVIAPENDSYKNATGVFFKEQNVSELLKTIIQFEKERQKFIPETCRKNALRFDVSVFKALIKKHIDAHFLASNKKSCIPDNKANMGQKKD